LSITPPPLDEVGRVIAHDHADILDDWMVVRRIRQDWLKDATDGFIGLSTAAFNESSEPPMGMSIDIVDLISANEILPHAFIISAQMPFAVVFQVGELRQLNLKVGFDPLVATSQFPANPFHGEVWGVLTRGIKNELRKIANWYVAPD
jgi:hypothetical protein